MASSVALLAVLCILFHACVLPVCGLNGYGNGDGSARLDYSSRISQVFLNAVRMDPSGFKSSYLSGYTTPGASSMLGSSSYPPVAPLPFHWGLLNSSYAHAVEVTNGCAFNINACNGSGVATRVAPYYNCNSNNVGGSIGQHYTDAIDQMEYMLCQSSGGTCATDKSGSDVNRYNIMNSAYAACGVGFSSSGTSSTYTNIIEQDFGTCVAQAPYPTAGSIYGGSHRISGGQTTFYAVYYNTTALPGTAFVVLSNEGKLPLAKELGVYPGAGLYSYNEPTYSACRTYYFLFNGTMRYPDTGCFQTIGEGSCTSAAWINTAACPSATASLAPYYVFTSALQNNWVTSGLTLTSPSTYAGVTGGYVTFPSSSQSIVFGRTPAVTNAWTNVVFNVAASDSACATANACAAIIQFVSQSNLNQGFYVTNSWKTVTIPLSNLGSPATVGGANSFKFALSQMGTASTFTMYISNLYFS